MVIFLLCRLRFNLKERAIWDTILISQLTARNQFVKKSIVKKVKQKNEFAD